MPDAAPRCRVMLHQMATLLAKSGQSPLPQVKDIGREQEMNLAYRMVAERDNETVKIERQSSLVIVAKARVWASEGWQVVITDADGKSYAPNEFEHLLAA